MTKMTVLHFASPFAFSMPVVPKDPGPLRPAERTEAEHGSETALTVGRSDPPSGAKAASETVRADDEHRDVSLLDTVLRRYDAHAAGAVDADTNDAV